MTQTSTWQRRASQARAKLDAARAGLATARAAAAAADEHFYDCEEAQGIVQAVAAAMQQEAHDRIAGVVGTCLSTVFEEPYEFRIAFERTRGRTEARLTFVREGQEVSPMDASGGGVVDVAAFGLRIASIMAARPAVRRLVVMDEPFKFVSVGHRAAVRALLEMLAEKLDLQIVMVTHIDELRCGTVIEIE
jgi:DNA repair exonuclease SbcCD ATPase subunit